MTKVEIAALFAEMADIMEILGENPFRVGSYRRAARTIQDAGEDLAVLAAAGELTKLPGIGASTAEKIEELLKTGKLKRHEELLAQVPPGLPGLIRVQGLGPKTALKLWKEGGITSLDELRECLAKSPEKLLAVGGMGEKKLAQFREALSFVQTTAGRFRLDEAEQAAGPLAEAVTACPGAQRVVLAGSFRRRQETVGDVDILCQASEKHAAPIMDAFTASEGVTRVLSKGPTKASVLVRGPMQVDLRIVPKASYGSALQYFTGSKAHNVALRGLAVKRRFKLNEYGLFALQGQGKEETERYLTGQSEQDVYKALGLSWIEPELREDRGELDAAAAGKLPTLLVEDDIRGDLHVHTTASDGTNSIEEMIRACRARGYKYLAITDHSRSQYQAGGLDERRMLEHIGAIRQAAAGFPDMLVLAGAEVDILKDGRLDFSDELLAQLDVVTASPHAALNQNRQEATARLVKAIENRYVHVIGHPSGRLINQRAGMDIDIEKLADAAARNDTAFEVNADPRRLDLRDVHIRTAIAKGAKVVICTDAHDTGSLGLMRFGVATARRGWATAADVVNTSTPSALKKWLAKKRA